MYESDIITGYAKDARALRAMAENVLEAPPPGLDPKVRELVEKLLVQAKVTEDQATAPVNIGVVGQFNSGKSLLLGALMGFADGLPVLPYPTTGNITALHFTQQEGLATTEFKSFTIEYLNHREAQDCLQAMLNQVRKSARAAPLRADLIEKLDQFQAADQNSLSGLDPWCASAWAASEDPTLLTNLRELVAFARAYFRCGRGMCEAPEYVVARQVAVDGLKLPPPREVRGQNFSDLPAPPRPITSAPSAAEMNADLIRMTFPLIRRVRVDVAVSAAIWNLSALTGEDKNKFVLLDFPGLGSAFSGVRDRYLCEREMERVQTILIVVNSDRSGARAWDGLLEPMQASHPDLQDSILVALGRFDLLELKNEGELKLKELGQPGPAPAALSRSQYEEIDDDDVPAPAPAPAAAPTEVTEELVKDQLPVLKGLLNVAELLVPNNGMGRSRIVPVSPMLSLYLLREQQPTIQVGTSEFLENLDADAQQALRVRPLWDALAQKLAHGRTRRPDEHGLTEWLTNFAVDGGINRLRKLIGSHVQAHGLSQLARDVAVKGEALRERLKELRAVIAPRGTSTDVRLPPERVKAVQTRFEKLGEYYRTLIHSVNRQETLVIEREGRLVPVSEIVEAETRFLISEWPQWDALFQASRDGYISERDGIGPGDLEDVDDDEGEDDGIGGDGFPTTSEDFYPAFEATLKRLVEFTETQIQAGLDFWLARLRRELAGESAELGPLLNTPGLAARLRKLRLGPNGRGLVIWLKASINPPELKQYLQPQGSVSHDDPDRVWEPRKLFPLTQGASDREPARIFGWAKELQHPKDPACRPSRNLSHVCQVIRLREEFIRVLSEEMAQTVSVAVTRLNARLVNVLTTVNTRLAKVSGDDRVRETLLTAVHAQEGSAPEEDPAQALQQFATFRWSRE